MARSHLALLAAILLGAPACAESAASTPAASRQARPSPEVSAPAPTGMPAGQPSDVKRLEGEVSEVLGAGHYTYARLGTDAGERWVVVMGELGLEAGDAAAFVVHYEQQDFHSRILDRDFDRLFFGALDSSATEADPSRDPA